MIYPHILILIIILIATPIVAYCESAPQQKTAHDPSMSLPENPQRNQLNYGSQLKDQPPSYNDFTNFTLSTPEKATKSFALLFNGIMPPTPETDLHEICLKSAIPSYREGCLQLLESRLSYLKSIRSNLKGARFTYQPSVQLSKSPMKLKANWKEELYFFDNSRKLNNKSMTITLQKSGSDWKIKKVEEF